MTTRRTTAAIAADRRREYAAILGAAGGRAGKGVRRPYAAANLAKARARRWLKNNKDSSEFTSAGRE